MRGTGKTSGSLFSYVDLLRMLARGKPRMLVAIAAVDRVALQILAMSTTKSDYREPAKVAEA